MEVSFLSQSLSVIALGGISSLVYLLSKKIKLPFTVLLVLVGILLIPLSKLSFFSFINHFELTPELLFFVFLPILIFESGYNMGYRQLIKNWKSIFTLAVLGLIISTLLVGVGMYYAFHLIGWYIPFVVALLFGAIISATDPVAVLALFKEFGAPRRLALIFEGESLFNDGTALALFLVLFEVVRSGVIHSSDIFVGIATFVCMIVGGIIFGGVFGFGFSWALGKTNNEYVEIGLTMILAHLTFILSELISHHVVIGGFELKISGVIATSIAAIVAGNYGRYKIGHKVEEYMDKFWSFFAFISNSLVFILMGLILSKLNVNFGLFIMPILIVIVIVMIARAISIYLPISVLNYFKVEERISMAWQHLLAWGSLRGALALMMVLMIPADFTMATWGFPFSIRDFLIAITIGSIMFTLFIKAPTMGPIINKLGINKLHELEEFEKDEGKVLIYLEIIKKINSIYSKGHITTEEFESLNKKYEAKLNESILELKNLLVNQKDKAESLIFKALSLHALGIEKQYLKELFHYNEIDEYIFRYLLRKIDRQIERIESGKPQIKGEGATQDIELTDKIINFFFSKEDTVIDIYLKNRTKFIISSKVISELEKLKEIDFGFDKKIFDSVLNLYRTFNQQSQLKMKTVYDFDKNIVYILNTRLVNKSLIKLEEKVVKSLHEKEIITPKLYQEFMDNIEIEIGKDIKAL